MSSHSTVAAVLAFKSRLFRLDRQIVFDTGLETSIDVRGLYVSEMEVNV